MTTDRPYRKALPADEALRRLREAAGSQFDPRVVEACLRVLDAGGGSAVEKVSDTSSPVSPA
jgi:HD-GYP domain-containing protein (c-di-GMP phosphodiesterase class II)